MRIVIEVFAGIDATIALPSALCADDGAAWSTLADLGRSVLAARASA